MTQPDTPDLAEKLAVEQCDRDAAERVADDTGATVAECVRIQRGERDDSYFVQAFARHRLSALRAQPAATAADLIALDGYRAALSYVAADSWDGCSDCIEVLKAARGTDVFHPYWSADEVAQALKDLRSRYYNDGNDWPQPAATEAVGDVLREALKQAEDTLDQILDDMRDGGQCVCLAVKEEAVETLAKVRAALSARPDERGAIVAWLRGPAFQSRHPEDAAFARHVADAIEHGYHLSAQGDDTPLTKGALS